MYLFDLDPRLAVLSEKNATHENEEQLGKAKIAKNDPASRLTNRIQKI